MARKQNKTTKMLKSGAKKLRNTETNILQKNPQTNQAFQKGRWRNNNKRNHRKKHFLIEKRQGLECGRAHRWFQDSCKQKYPKTSSGGITEPRRKRKKHFTSC